MTKKYIGPAAVVLALMGTVGFLPASAPAVELVDILTEQLGVTGEQAAGGAGAIFRQVKNSLSIEDFATVSAAIPDLDVLLKAAPAVEKVTGDLAKAKAAVEGVTGSLGGAADLAGSFSKLGLNPDMVGKFVPTILDFAGSKGGEGVLNLLKGVLPLP